MSLVPRAARRALSAVAALVVASVVLSGCLAVPRDVPDPVPDTSGVADELLPFYDQTLSWSDCASGFDCASVRVPLDWSQPSAGEVQLAIVRHRATNGAPLGALLVNPGGPGSSGVQLVRDSLSTAVRSSLQQSYDIVGFDPRGVGDSTAVRCYEDPADMDAYLFDIVAGARGSAQWQRGVDDRNWAFAGACDAGSDGILPFVSTENAARDMDVLRAVLGQQKLDYLGYSYGTFLGATYAELHPDRVGRFVLDGALDPQASSLDVSVEQGVGFESALRAFMADCLGTRDCPFSGTVDGAMTDLATLLASVDGAPLANADGRRLGADSLMTAIVAALYSPSSWTAFRRALGDALKGDPGVAFQLADFYYNRVGGTYVDSTTEPFRAYNCADYPPVDAREEAEGAARLAQDAPTIAPYWLGRDPCLVWTHPATGRPHRIAAEGAAPILVIGTTNDPATPYSWAVSLADQLSSGVLITRVGEGHTGYNKGNTCVNDAVESYFLNGTVPADGLRCG